MCGCGTTTWCDGGCSCGCDHSTPAGMKRQGKHFAAQAEWKEGLWAEAKAEVERLRASLALQAESVENAAAEVARLREREARVEALRDRLAASTEVVGAKVLAVDVSRALRGEA